MPIYHSLGQIPPKRHTQFRKPDGSLYVEEVFGTHGFSGNESILYHLNSPARITGVAFEPAPSPEVWQPHGQHHHHLKTGDIPIGGDAISGRVCLLFNDDVTWSLSRPTEPMPAFYRNGIADELYFIHEGSGTLRSVFGALPYGPGDYLLVPRGTTYRLDLDAVPQRHLVIESFGQLETPKRYRNAYGQLMEHAPFTQRDIRRPAALETHDERGDFEVRLKLRDGVTCYTLDYHPFDVVGWDGYVYPWALNIADFEPITGRVHQPPPVHQTFEGPNFVVCSFVPRKFDYHPLAIPAPYHHSNIDSEEVMYYVSGNFMSRRGVEVGSTTLHPRGIPHGPHPGAAEASIGKEGTEELAVMVDTFRPLKLTAAARTFEDDRYPFSWLEETGRFTGSDSMG
ncbi:MAG: homogentisate 1,2-dioxygenase [Chloroflexota bacterium]|nr:homogentisate 1,2-dioxygenase [Chloroflexota bacterium]